jgi:hypothetical protein
MRNCKRQQHCHDDVRDSVTDLRNYRFTAAIVADGASGAKIGRERVHVRRSDTSAPTDSKRSIAAAVHNREVETPIRNLALGVILAASRSRQRCVENKFIILFPSSVISSRDISRSLE